MTDVAIEELQWDRPVLLIGASPDLDPDMVGGIDPHWPLIAVDGGLDTAHSAGLRPSLVLGDMDSVRRVPDDVQALQLDGQNDTDLEKALQRLSAPLIIGFGFLDGRLDHVLASMHAITRLQRNIPVILVGRRDVLLRPVEDVALSLVQGTRFAARAWRQLETSANFGIEYVFVIKTAVPLLGFLLLVTAALNLRNPSPRSGQG